MRIERKNKYLKICYITDLQDIYSGYLNYTFK